MMPPWRMPGAAPSAGPFASAADVLCVNTLHSLQPAERLFTGLGPPQRVWLLPQPLLLHAPQLLRDAPRSQSLPPPSLSAPHPLSDRTRTDLDAPRSSSPARRLSFQDLKEGFSTGALASIMPDGKLSCRKFQFGLCKDGPFCTRNHRCPRILPNGSICAGKHAAAQCTGPRTEYDVGRYANRMPDGLLSCRLFHLRICSGSCGHSHRCPRILQDGYVCNGQHRASTCDNTLAAALAVPLDDGALENTMDQRQNSRSPGRRLGRSNSRSASPVIKQRPSFPNSPACSTPRSSPSRSRSRESKVREWVRESRSTGHPVRPSARICWNFAHGYCHFAGQCKHVHQAPRQWQSAHQWDPKSKVMTDYKGQWSSALESSQLSRRDKRLLRKVLCTDFNRGVCNNTHCRRLHEAPSTWARPRYWDQDARCFVSYVHQCTGNSSIDARTRCWDSSLSCWDYDPPAGLDSVTEWQGRPFLWHQPGLTRLNLDTPDEVPLRTLTEDQEYERHNLLRGLTQLHRLRLGPCNTHMLEKACPLGNGKAGREKREFWTHLLDGNFSATSPTGTPICLKYNLGLQCDRKCRLSHRCPCKLQTQCGSRSAGEICNAMHRALDCPHYEMNRSLFFASSSLPTSEDPYP